MSERTLVNYTLSGMKGRWDWPVKHADPYTAGVADLSGYVPGAGNVWIECKALDNWPVRATTIVKLSKYTDEQRHFLINRRGFLWLRAGRDYLLFFGARVLPQLGRELDKQLMFERCLLFWNGKVDWTEFVTTIKIARPNG